VVDGLLAGTAFHDNLTLVSRNTRDPPTFSSRSSTLATPNV
jgi:predicted nucleic acid-binding protein